MANITKGVQNLAQALAFTHQQASRPAFEYQFSQIQDTVINRLNAEIKKVNEADGDKAHIAELQREGKKLATLIPAIDKYVFDNKNNSSRLSAIYDNITSMVGLFTDDDNISAGDLTTFNTLKAEVTTELNKLTQLTYPGVTDGDVIRKLKNEIATFEALAPVEGVVDAAGTTPTTNVNLDVLTSLESLQTQTSTAQTVTNNTIYNAFDMRQDMVAKASEIQAEVTSINVVEQQKKADEIQELKDKYANMLRAISLSYESTSNYAGELSKQLSAPIPEKGSVLNLFS